MCSRNFESRFLKVFISVYELLKNIFLVIQLFQVNDEVILINSVVFLWENAVNRRIFIVEYFLT